MHRMNTIEGRRRTLQEADNELRIEGLHRDPATAAILEAWADGTLTGVAAIVRLGEVHRARRASTDASLQEK